MAWNLSKVTQNLDTGETEAIRTIRNFETHANLVEYLDLEYADHVQRSDDGTIQSVVLETNSHFQTYLKGTEVPDQA